MRTLKYNFT